MKNLSSGKAAASENPVDILKNSEFCFSKLTKCINKAFNENKFPDTLKLCNIVLVFKKFDPTDKTNFRLVSLLPLLSKAFEKIVYDQLMNMFCICSTWHFWISYFVVFVKLTQRRMHFPELFRNDNKN